MLEKIKFLFAKNYRGQERQGKKLLKTEEQEFQNLAEGCSMGDEQAMLKMFYYFRRQLPQEFLLREKEREESGTGTSDRFMEYLNEDKEAFFCLQAAGMWLVRAALYGSEEAKKFLGRHPKYQEFSYFPMKMVWPKSSEVDYEQTCEGTELRRMGLLNFREDREYHISSFRLCGYYIVRSYVGYEDPDEDGFGMENLYDFQAYDEFFNKLCGLSGYSNLDYRNHSEEFHKDCRRCLEEQEKKRELYWSKQRGNRKNYTFRKFSGSMIKENTVLAYMDEGPEYIELPEGISRIGTEAFCGCTKLRHIKLPKSLTFIGREAFQGCKSLQEIKIPEQINEVGTEAFSGCFSLERVILSERMKEIKPRLFERSGLKEIEIPEGIVRIGEQAFSCCRELKEITIPETVKYIGKRAFWKCEELFMADIKGKIECIEERTFEDCERLESVIMEESIKRIETEAFAGCQNLKNVVFPKELKTIRMNAFRRCENLQELRLPEGLEELGYGAFSDCAELRSVFLPGSLQYIGGEAFSGKREIMFYVLPGSIGEGYVKKEGKKYKYLEI